MAGNANMHPASLTRLLQLAGHGVLGEPKWQHGDDERNEAGEKWALPLFACLLAACFLPRRLVCGCGSGRRRGRALKGNWVGGRSSRPDNIPGAPVKSDPCFLPIVVRNQQVLQGLPELRVGVLLHPLIRPGLRGGVGWHRRVLLREL